MNGSVYLIVVDVEGSVHNLILGMAASLEEAEKILLKIRGKRSKFVLGKLKKKDIYIQKTILKHGVVPELFQEAIEYRSNEEHSVINIL